MDPEEIKERTENDPPAEKTEEAVNTETGEAADAEATEAAPVTENVIAEDTESLPSEDNHIADGAEAALPEESVNAEAEETVSWDELAAQEEVAADLPAAAEEAKDAGNTAEKAGSARTFRIAGILLCLAAVVIMVISLLVIMKADEVKEHYNGDAWYTQYSRGERSVSGNKAFPESLATEDSAIAERFSYGNSDELYAANAGACEDSGYYYFADPTDKGFLCRVSKKENGKKVRLCEISAENLNILYGRIYFINHFTAGGDSAGIYSIARDGSGLKQLLEGSFYSLRMVNDWLYYIGGEDGSIRRMNIHGLSEEVLCSEDCNDLWVACNSIYYISQDKDRPVSERMVICSMSVDGTERKEIVERGYYNALSYHNGILYYSVYNSGYGWIDTSRKEEEPAEGEAPVANPQNQPPHEGFVALKGIYSPVIAHGDDMWYIDRSDLRSLSVYTPESGRIRHYDTENISSFYLMSDLIVVRWLKDGITPLVSVNRLSTGEMVDLFSNGTED